MTWTIPQSVRRRGQPDSILARIERTEGCWLWRGTILRTGYGRFGRIPAHRVVYELLVGPIPDGLVIDHLCRNPPCVNPAHLEPVTVAENNRRGYGWSGSKARQTHCKRGHALTPDNIQVRPDRPNTRECRTCHLHADRERIAAKRRAA